MKRARAPNFTNSEIMHLLLLVEKYPIIENKKTDGATSREKLEAWKELAEEYNSSTSAGPRTADNLMSCYKNQKIKVKKKHSQEKMSIAAPLHFALPGEPGPSHQNHDVQILLEAVEVNGQDWESVSHSTNIPKPECEITFQNLVKKAKKQDAAFSKEVKRTGGGPPPVPPSDLILEKVKTLIGPSLEGLYTSYGGDCVFMEQQQLLLPKDKRTQPIDVTPSRNLPKLHESESSPQTPPHPISLQPKRLNLLKKKVDPLLETISRGKKKNVSEAFQELAKEKKELVELKKKICSNQLLHQEQLHEINVEIAKEKLAFEKIKNEMELNFLRAKYEADLYNLKNKE